MILDAHYGDNGRHRSPNGHEDGIGRGEARGERRPRLIYLANGEVIEVGSENSAKKEPGRDHEKSLKTAEFTKSWLDGETPVEPIEDPTNPSRMVLAVRRAGKIEFVDHLEHEGLALVPPSRRAEPFRSMAVPAGVLPYDSSEKLAARCGEFIRGINQLSGPTESILSTVVLHTWIWDWLPLAVCPVLFAPSDFTDFLLRTLALICRRSVIVGGANASGILDACSGFDVTLLFTRDTLSRSALEAVNMGSEQGCLHLGSEIVSPFGPKVIAASEWRVDLEHLRGGFTLPLNLSAFPRWERLSDCDVLARADQLRRQLLQFRFDHVDSMKIPKGAASLRYPKRGLITGVLVAPFASNLDFCKRIAGYLDQIGDDPSERLPADKSAVVSAGFRHFHDKQVLADGEVTVGQIAESVDEILAARGEKFKLSPRRVGSILTGLGFPHRPRSSYGYRVQVDRDAIEAIHHLAKLYGVSSPNPYDPWGPFVECECCRNLGLVSSWEIRQFEQSRKAAEEQRAQATEVKRATRIDSSRKQPLAEDGLSREVNGRNGSEEARGKMMDEIPKSGETRGLARAMDQP